MANAWVPGKFDGAEVDHIDYNRNNYNADNLRWVNHTENIAHSVIDENHYKGKRSGIKNGRATLDKDEVKQIKSLFNQGLSTTEVIRTLNPQISTSGIRSVWNKYNRIKTGETWK